MYSVIEFTNENSVEAVPTNWVITTGSSEKLCLWPPFKGKPLTNAIQENIRPELSWTAHPCRLIKTELGR